MLTDAELAEIEARAKTQPDLVMGEEFEDEVYDTFVALAVAGDYGDWLLCPSGPPGIETARSMGAFHAAAKSTILTLLAELRRLRAAVAVPSVLNEVGKVAAQVLADREAELCRLRTERDQAEGEAAGWQARCESVLADKIKAYYDLKTANAEIDRLRGMKRATCGEWNARYTTFYPTSDASEPRSIQGTDVDGLCAVLRQLTLRKFSCNQWRSP